MTKEEILKKSQSDNAGKDIEDLDVQTGKSFLIRGYYERVSCFKKQSQGNPQREKNVPDRPGPAGWSFQEHNQFN